MCSNLLWLRSHSCSYEYFFLSLEYVIFYKGDGEIFAWGMGEYGALGTGKKNSHWSPTQIFLNEKFPLGAVKVSAGGRHTGFISGINMTFC